jgi:glycerol uptake facilitator-like aquaporin
MVVGMSMAITFNRTGAHLNPAVTGYLTVFTTIKASRLVVYLIAELLAATVGAVLVDRLVAASVLEPAIPVAPNPGWYLLKETIATLILLSLIALFIVLGIARWTIAVIPIFLSLMQLNLFGGADMNPAVTLARGLAGYYDPVGFWVRILGELIAMSVFLLVGRRYGVFRARFR